MVFNGKDIDMSIFSLLFLRRLSIVVVSVTIVVILGQVWPLASPPP